MNTKQIRNLVALSISLLFLVTMLLSFLFYFENRKDSTGHCNVDLVERLVNGSIEYNFDDDPCSDWKSQSRPIQFKKTYECGGKLISPSDWAKGTWEVRGDLIYIFGAIYRECKDKPNSFYLVGYQNDHQTYKSEGD